MINELYNESNRGQLVKEGIAASKIIDQFEQCTTAKQPVNKAISKPNKLSKDILDVFNNPTNSTPSQSTRVASGKVRNWHDMIESDKSRKNVSKTTTFFSENKELQRATEECASRARQLTHLREQYRTAMETLKLAMNLVGCGRRSRTPANHLDDWNMILSERNIFLDKLKELVLSAQRVGPNVYNKEVKGGSGVSDTYSPEDSVVSDVPSNEEPHRDEDRTRCTQSNSEGGMSTNSRELATDRKSVGSETGSNSRKGTMLGQLRSFRDAIVGSGETNCKSNRSSKSDNTDVEAMLKKQKADYELLSQRVISSEKEFMMAKESYELEAEATSRKIWSLESEVTTLKNEKLELQEDIQFLERLRCECRCNLRAVP